MKLWARLFFFSYLTSHQIFCEQLLFLSHMARTCKPSFSIPNQSRCSRVTNALYGNYVVCRWAWMQIESQKHYHQIAQTVSFQFCDIWNSLIVKPCDMQTEIIKGKIGASETSIWWNAIALKEKAVPGCDEFSFQTCQMKWLSQTIGQPQKKKPRPVRWDKTVNMLSRTMYWSTSLKIRKSLEFFFYCSQPPEPNIAVLDQCVRVPCSGYWVWYSVLWS